MKTLEVGTKVKALKSHCIGIMVDSWIYEGEIVKVNKKSIRVRFNKLTTKRGSKVEDVKNYGGEYNFRFSGTGKESGNDYYQNTLYGHITIR